MATLKIITDDDLANKGVIPLADVPGLPAEEMKQKFEEIVRDVVITAFNQNMGLLEDAVFVDPESHTYYLKQSDVLTTRQAIINNTDPGKLAGATAIKDIYDYLSGIYSSLSLRTSALEYTVGQHTTQIGNNTLAIAKLNSLGYITFEKNDGSETHVNQKTTIGYTSNTMSIPEDAPEFTRAGYTFLGWSTDKNSVDADYQAGDTVYNLDQYVYGNCLTLYAIWEENTP